MINPCNLQAIAATVWISSRSWGRLWSKCRSWRNRSEGSHCTRGLGDAGCLRHWPRRRWTVVCGTVPPRYWSSQRESDGAGSEGLRRAC